MQKVEYVTEEFEAAFPYLTSHEVFDGTSTGKFSLTMKFDEGSEGHKQLKAAIDEVHEGTHYPLKNGKGDFDRGKVICKAKSGFDVHCLDNDKKSISPAEIHRGDICRAKIVIQPWSKGSNSGTSCYLNAVQKVRSGAFSDSSSDFDKKDQDDTDLPF